MRPHGRAPPRPPSRVHRYIAHLVATIFGGPQFGHFDRHMRNMHHGHISMLDLQTKSAVPSIDPCSVNAFTTRGTLEPVELMLGLKGASQALESMTACDKFTSEEESVRGRSVERQNVTTAATWRPKLPAVVETVEDNVINPGFYNSEAAPARNKLQRTVAAHTQPKRAALVTRFRPLKKQNKSSISRIKCPFCNGTKGDVTLPQRNRRKTKKRRTIRLGRYWIGFGYSGVHYCTRCSEVFRDHLIRQMSNSAGSPISTSKYFYCKRGTRN
eukprot:SAG11_NODE_294_length_11142_cov_7.050439_14_plen_271_part_00